MKDDCFYPLESGFEKQTFLFCEPEAFNPIHKVATSKNKPVSAERKLPQRNSYWPHVLFHFFWQQDMRHAAPSSEHLPATESKVKPNLSLWAQFVSRSCLHT